MDNETLKSMTDETGNRFEERIVALERSVIILPVLAAEALLILSLFLPFVTVTSYNDEDKVATLPGLGLALFGGEQIGEADATELLFVGAFLVLLIVVLCNIVSIAFLTAGPVGSRSAGAITTFAVLLVLGTAGAWLVIALGFSSESPWLPEASSILLVAGTLLVAAVTLLSSFRSIWVRR
jgi:hypothetical protein